MCDLSSMKRAWLDEELCELEDKHVTKAEIARRLDILPQTLNNIINGTRGVSDSFLSKFASVFHISQIELNSPSIDTSSIFNRIDQVFEEKGISPEQFEKLFLKASGIYKNAKRRHNSIRIANQWAMSIVTAFPEYSLRWLLSGEGDKLIPTNNNNIIDLLKKENEQLRKDKENLWELVNRLSQK